MKIPPQSRGTQQIRAKYTAVSRRVILPLEEYIHNEAVAVVLLLAAAVISPIRCVVRDDEKITIGLEQAFRASEWLKSNIPSLAQRIGFQADELKQFNFKPLVICKDNLPSGFLGKTDVPVINQQLFDWIMIKPNQQDLRSLWQVADSMTYLPKLGVHYEKLSPTVKWGEMVFILKNVALRIIKRWNPKTDIFFEPVNDTL
jgi:hypothetical protein